MPWFITAIAPKTPERPRQSRTFGFYNTYTEAYVACKENRGNMVECLYDYLIVEYIEPGIHPEVHLSVWWKWNEFERCWKYIFDEEAPKEFVGITNWALG